VVEVEVAEVEVAVAVAVAVDCHFHRHHHRRAGVEMARQNLAAGVASWRPTDLAESLSTEDRQAAA
jgi:hypothetical protein